MIEVSSLVKRFGGYVALHGLSFAVARGAVVGFLGQNGAGKTTTLRITACFLPPTTGSVRVCGFDTVAQSLEVRRRLGYLPESVPLYLDLRVAEYLRFRARLKGVPAKDVTRAVDEAASRCLLGEVLKRPIGTLSKGFRQRVGLADAVVHRPEVLVLDEPTSGLDPTQRLEVRALIRGLGGDRTVLVSTHILPEVEAVCERVVVIHKGRVLTDRAVADLKETGRVRLRWRDAAGGPERAAEIDDAAEASRRAAEVVRGGGALLELAPVRESLESVFTRLTTEADV
ncbi:MAG TPA: ATP-binding cassette domain-containing protein [Planctomycetota bacterium]|nr:ATP-binding cassette domain-containing protein [Planctomycetota bacterium]